MNASDFVTVKNLTLPRSAVSIVLEAEAKGVHLRADADGSSILAEPVGLLTAEEKAEIRRWRWHIRALLAICEPSAAPGLARERRMIGELLEALEKPAEVSKVDELAPRRQARASDSGAAARRRKSG